MHCSAGILTSTGGMTSHAAVVARGWGKCCVAGAGEVKIDEKAKKAVIKGRTFTDKDVISIDGTTGEVMSGSVETQEPKLSGDFAKLMEWSDSIASWLFAPTPTRLPTACELATSVHKASLVPH